MNHDRHANSKAALVGVPTLPKAILSRLHDGWALTDEQEREAAAGIREACLEIRRRNGFSLEVQRT